MRKYVWPQILVIMMMGFLFGGCSTFEVRNTYRLAGKESSLLKYNANGVELRAGINPDPRFYSIGILGLPIIPVYFKTSDPREIVLTIELTLHHDYDFSFASQPCLKVDNSPPLCPDRLSISAMALFQDDGSKWADRQKRWMRISNFHNTEKLIIDFLAARESDRVSRERIYQHYGYSGEKKWGYLWVGLAYHYKCGDTCPSRLGLDAKDLVIVENLPTLTDNYILEKVREKEYHFTASIE